MPLARMFRGPADLATDLVPWVLRMLAPDVKPVVVNTASSSAADKSRNTNTSNFATASVRRAAEKALVARAVNAMAATGVRFEKTRVEDGASGQRQGGGWVYRMEPPLDELGAFGTMGAAAGSKSQAAVRYGVRQVLEAEWRREEGRRGEMMRRARMGGAGSLAGEEGEGDGEDGKKRGGKSEGEKHEEAKKGKGFKRDFFGRVIQEVRPVGAEAGEDSTRKRTKTGRDEEGDHPRVWVSFHEGYSNAVRKPVTLAELMAGL